jgi:hypothetical protein
MSVPTAIATEKKQKKRVAKLSLMILFHYDRL